MLRSSFWLTLLILAACSIPAENEESAVRDVETVVISFWDAVDRFDFVAIESALTPDFELLKSGRRDDRAAFLQQVRGADAAGASLSFELSEFNTEVSGTTAYTSYRSQSRTSESQTFEAILLVLTDDGWKIDRGFATPIRR